MNNLNSSHQLFKVPTAVGPTLPLVVDETRGRWIALGLVSHTLGLSLGNYTLPRTEKPSWGRRRVNGHECLPIDRCPQFFASIKEGSVPATARPFLFWARQHAFRAMSDFTIPTPAVPMLEVEPGPVEVVYVPQIQAVVDLVTMNGTEPVTTSLAIAQGTQNDHASVIKLVRTYQSDLEEFGPLGFEIQVSRADGRGGEPTQFAVLTEPQATLLMTYMRNSDIVRKFKMRLVKAFYELAHQQVSNQNPANLSRLQILTMAIEAEQKVQELSCKVQERDATIADLEPKAAGLDRIATMTNDCARTLTDAAKILQQAPRKFNTYLQVEGWIYRQNGRWMAYQDKITKGLMEHKFCNVQHDNGTEFDVAQALITPKGIAKLAVTLCVPVAA